MNSDFVQQQAELLAGKLTTEPDSTAKIQKLYSLLYGRQANAEEVQTGLEFLKEEPMRAYEERKAAEKEKKEKAKKDKPTSDKEAKEVEDTPEPAASEPVATEAGGGQAPMSMGMMAGMMGPAEGRRGAPGKDAKPTLPVTIWGRYVKILMSSPEFQFVN